MKKHINRWIQIAFEGYVTPWYENTYYKKSYNRTQRAEVAEKIEQALSRTSWAERGDDLIDDEYSVIVQHVDAEPLDTGGYVLMVYLVDSQEHAIPEGSFELSDFLITFQPKTQFTFQDLDS